MSNASRTLFICTALAVALPAAGQFPSSVSGETQAMPQSPYAAPPLPSTPQTLTSGLWRVDQGFVSTIQVKNAWVVSPMNVTPVLYMADGTPYPLPSVHLAATATTTIDINHALAHIPSEVAEHLSQFGSVALHYKGNIGAVIAAITIINPLASLSYAWQMQSAMNGASSMQTLEGLWWRHDDGVGGFVALSNSTSQRKEVTVQLITERGRQLPPEIIPIAAYATEMLDLDFLTTLPREEARAGGLRIQFDGQIGEINIAGGLANWTEGYSAVMPFWTTMTPMGESMPSAPQTLSNVGLMVGAPDPMMNFPAGTRVYALFGVAQYDSSESGSEVDYLSGKWKVVTRSSSAIKTL